MAVARHEPRLTCRETIAERLQQPTRRCRVEDDGAQRRYRAPRRNGWRPRVRWWAAVRPRGEPRDGGHGGGALRHRSLRGWLTELRQGAPITPTPLALVRAPRRRSHTLRTPRSDESLRGVDLLVRHHVADDRWRAGQGRPQCKSL